MQIGIWVARPSRERSALATATENGKCQDEHQHLSATVKCSTNDVVVLDEQLGVATTQEPLRKEADDEVHGYAGVDADKQPTHVPEDHGQVHVLEESDLGVAVSQPEGNRHDEAEEVSDGDPLVSAADREELCGHGPCDGERIEPVNASEGQEHQKMGLYALLNVLTAPDVATLNRLQDSALIIDNRDHPVFLNGQLLWSTE